MDAADRLMTLTELTEVLGIPLATRYGCPSRGERPSGDRIGRYRREAIEIWLKPRSGQPVHSANQPLVSDRRSGGCRLASVMEIAGISSPAATAEHRAPARSMLASRRVTPAHRPPVDLGAPAGWFGYSEALMPRWCAGRVAAAGNSAVAQTVASAVSGSSNRTQCGSVYRLAVTAATIASNGGFYCPSHPPALQRIQPRKSWRRAMAVQLPSSAPPALRISYRETRSRRTPDRHDSA